jgi:hypothetical protein
MHAALRQETLQKTAEQEKEAVIGELLTGLAGHFGVNALGRHAHHASNLPEMLAHQGFQHGATGRMPNFWSRASSTNILGPEVGIQYWLGHALGKQLYNMPPAERAQAMKAMKEAGSIGVGDLPPDKLELLKKAPYLNDAFKAVMHDYHGTTPEFKANDTVAKLYGQTVQGFNRLTTSPYDTHAQNVVKEVAGALPMAGLLAADAGGAAVHMGWNRARAIAGGSEFGKRWQEGLAQKGMRGELPNKATQLAYDIGVSPAYLDAQRLGHAVHQAELVPALETATHVAGQHPDLLPHEARGWEDVVRRILPKPTLDEETDARLMAEVTRKPIEDYIKKRGPLPPPEPEMVKRHIVPFGALGGHMPPPPLQKPVAPRAPLPLDRPDPLPTRVPLPGFGAMGAHPGGHMEIAPPSQTRLPLEQPPESPIRIPVPGFGAMGAHPGRMQEIAL